MLNDPGGAASLAAVPGWAERAVVAAAEDCPGECIFIETPAEAFGDAAGEAFTAAG